MRLILTRSGYLTLLLTLLFGTCVRAQCPDPTATTNLEVNDVTAALHVNGNLWDRGTGADYTVRTPDGTLPAPAAIYSGSLWIGGRLPDGSLFARTPQYTASSSAYNPGPLDIDGNTTVASCARWDRLFTVTAEDVRELQSLYTAAEAAGTLPLSANEVPASLLEWPASFNPQFETAAGFPLPARTDGLAPFIDVDLDGIYDPTQGDYPLFCGSTATWYLFHTNPVTTQGTVSSAPFEISVLAYAYASSDADLNRTTFYDYQITSKGLETVSDFYVGHFIDSDLGCGTNDRVESNPERGLFYVYNDAATEPVNCQTGGTVGFGDNAPVNVFQVRNARFVSTNPDGSLRLDTSGMQQLVTTYNSGISNPNPETTDPRTPMESYNLLQGRWRDGTVQTRGGDGYGTAGETTRFSFDGGTVNGEPWLSCQSGVAASDIRSVYSLGPHVMSPGQVSRFTLAVTTLFDVPYTNNCPDRTTILDAADAIRERYTNECTVDQLETSVRPVTAAAAGLRVFPNPAREVLNFSLTGGQTANKIDLFDLRGRNVRSARVSGRQFSLPLTHAALPAGTYVYRLRTVAGGLITGKVSILP